MTGYTIEVGYNSSHHKEDVWDELVKAVKNLRKNPNRIFDEVIRVEKHPEDGTIEDLKKHTEHYRNCDDLTITIHDKPEKWENPEEFEPDIGQLASSGNGFRGIKEQCRRAVCRLLLEAMHKKGMEINIIVS